jgi:hypothetical protein
MHSPHLNPTLRGEPDVHRRAAIPDRRITEPNNLFSAETGRDVESLMRHHLAVNQHRPKRKKISDLAE